MPLVDPDVLAETTAAPAAPVAPASRAFTEHGTQAYLARRRTRGIALCLSGGGFRAALFHLGAIRRLDELGVLSQLETISSVSGGSILAAFLADRAPSPWPRSGPVFPDFERQVATPFGRFTAENIRTRPILKRLLPWNWLRQSIGVESLADLYEARLTKLRLRELPERPNFVLCATDMVFAVNWVFERDRMGDYQAGYVKPPADWPLARSVAASSCFPPVFNPLPMKVRPDELSGGIFPKGAKRDACLSDLRLTDGGTYDNLGLEPVWKDHQAVLVSDGGATLDYEADENLFWRLTRYVEIQGNQALALRKRWLMEQFRTGDLRGAYWGIGSPVAHYWDRRSNPDRNPHAGYDASLVEEVIAEIRTDMDAFSEAEAAVLQNHGYLLAEAALRQHADWLADGTPLRVPYGDWLDEAAIRAALKNSARRKLPFGRT